MSDVVAEALRCLLVPMQSGVTLLLPNSAVAEVVPYQTPADGADGADGPADATSPRLGTLEWRGQRLTVLAFERLRGVPFRPPGRGARLIVLHRVGGAPAGRYYAIVGDAIPHLTVVREGSVTRDADAAAGGPVLEAVRVGDTPALVPDLDALEAWLG